MSAPQDIGGAGSMRWDGERDLPRPYAPSRPPSGAVTRTVRLRPGRSPPKAIWGRGRQVAQRVGPAASTGATAGGGVTASWAPAGGCQPRSNQEDGKRRQEPRCGGSSAVERVVLLPIDSRRGGGAVGDLRHTSKASTEAPTSTKTQITVVGLVPVRPPANAARRAQASASIHVA